MKKSTFIFILVATVAVLIIAIVGAVNNKTGLIATIPVCLCMIFLTNSLYEASKSLEWYINHTKELEEHCEELKKAISAKDEAISSYKWEIDSLKRKIR